MSSLVEVKNPNGVTYVYENISHWNKEREKVEHQRRCIGHRDAATGEVVPNGKRGGLRRGKPAAVIPPTRCAVYGCGLTMLCGRLAQDLGLQDVLRQVFPQDWAEILTCAFYVVAERSALSCAEQWTEDNISPAGKVLTSQRIAELLPRLRTERQQEFFAQWLQRQNGDRYWCMDITSISSYSGAIEWVEQGYNRDGEHLPQINLLLVTGQDTHLPFFFRTLPGSLHDVNTLQDSVAQMRVLDAQSAHLVMDKGFFSAANVDALYAAAYKFTLGLPFTCYLAREAVDKWRTRIDAPDQLLEVLGRNIHGAVDCLDWHGQRCYRHVYFDRWKAAHDMEEFDRRLLELRHELESDRPIAANQKLYERFFIVSEDADGRKHVAYNRAAVAARGQNTAGWFTLLSNEIQQPQTALEVYRRKDAVEKCFDDLKNELDLRRLRIHTSDALDGRIFIQFLACILLTAIRERLHRAGWLVKDFSSRLIISRMKSLQVVVPNGRHKPMISTPTKFQRDIMKLFNLNFETVYNSIPGI